MNSRVTHETLQKYYQLPGKNIINQGNFYPGKDTNPKLFLLDRGGNRGFLKDPYEGFNNVTNRNKKENFETNLEDNLENKLEDKKKFKFYPGDQILHRDYFKGWNDSFFFQTSLFRKEPKFWLTPFKSDYFQGK